MMSTDRHLRWRLRGASVLALCVCAAYLGGTNPGNAASAGAAATVRRYFAALRGTDVEGVRATLAPDYHFDRSDPPAFDPVDPFDRPLGLTYCVLYDRIEALTTVGKTATAFVTTTFEGNLNLEFADLGRPLVNGDSRLVMELEPQGAEWKLTAVRPVRVTYVTPESPRPTLSNYTVNGRTSLRVPPGTTLMLAGRSNVSSLIIGVIGTPPVPRELMGKKNELWELQLKAPDTPGRYLVSAFALHFDTKPDPETGKLRFLDGDQLTIPVTVVNPR
jgi:hypothetical protein